MSGGLPSKTNHMAMLSSGDNLVVIFDCHISDKRIKSTFFPTRIKYTPVPTPIQPINKKCIFSNPLSRVLGPEPQLR
jgi:hypothetical protein